MVILKHDQTARSWVFNYYCPKCARFLYVEDFAQKSCRKCKAAVTNAIGHAIPFSTSATATEKLIDWIINSDLRNQKQLLECVSGAISIWLGGYISSQQYRQQVVDGVGKLLDQELASRAATL